MERLPDIDIDLELAGAQRVGHTTKAKIRKCCPISATRYMQGFAGRFFLVSPRRVVFVVASPNVIVTVFQLKDDYEQ